MNDEEIMSHVEHPIEDVVNVEVTSQIFTHMAHLRATDFFGEVASLIPERPWVLSLDVKAHGIFDAVHPSLSELDQIAFLLTVNIVKPPKPATYIGLSGKKCPVPSFILVPMLCLKLFTEDRIHLKPRSLNLELREI